MDKLDLDKECVRLRNARLKALGFKEDKFKIHSLSRDSKIEYLAKGVAEGWYGTVGTQRAMLKNLYKEVTNKLGGDLV